MQTTNAVVPDGGWGWVVVAAVALINMTNQSILSVFGQLFGSELKRMHQETFTQALITNLNSLALNFSGLFIGPAIKSFKPRNVAASGCVLVSFGLFICSFATEGWHFIVGYSFFVGLGLGLISPSTFMAINSYFSSKRGRAVGVSLAGAGLGQVFIPHIVCFLLDNYGFRTAVLAMSALSLFGLIGAIFLKPLTPLHKHDNRKNIKLLLETSKEKVTLQTVTVTSKQEIQTNTDTIITSQNKLCSKICHRLVQAMDLELLQDAVFWSILIGMALVYTATISFTMLYPHFLEHSVGLSKPNIASCMSIMAGADIVCRLVLPCITDRLKIPYRVIFLLGTVGLFIVRTAMAESNDLSIIILMSILTGMTKSATVLNNNLTISAHCRSEKLAGGLGLNMISKGVLVITIGQFLGWIRDYTDSYVIGLHAQNVLLLLVVLIWTPEIIYRYRRQRKESNQTKSIESSLEATTEELTKINAC